jgi:hypothetical protein
MICSSTSRIRLIVVFRGTSFDAAFGVGCAARRIATRARAFCIAGNVPGRAASITDDSGRP